MRIMHTIRGITEICQKHDLKPTKLRKYFIPIPMPRATFQRRQDRVTAAHPAAQLYSSSTWLSVFLTPSTSSQTVLIKCFFKELSKVLCDLG